MRPGETPKVGSAPYPFWSVPNTCKTTPPSEWLPENRVPNSIKRFEIIGLCLQEQNDTINWVYPMFQNPRTNPTMELLHPGWQPQAAVCPQARRPALRRAPCFWLGLAQKNKNKWKAKSRTSHISFLLALNSNYRKVHYISQWKQNTGYPLVN